MAVRIEKILCWVLHEAHGRQVEETMETLAEGPKGLYTGYRVHRGGEQAAEDRKKAATLQEAAYKPSPFGAVNQHLIKDLRVKDDTATVELEKLEGPGSKSRSWQARSEAEIICDSIASIARSNEIAVDTVNVLNANRVKVATCEVAQEQRTTTGEPERKTAADKTKQRTTPDRPQR